jgi:flavorubredoxin
MNIHIFYESKYGNGKEAMIYLQNALKKKNHSVQLMSIHDVNPRSLSEANLYIFSAPNAFGKIIRSMRKFLERIEIKDSNSQYILVNTCLDPASGQDRGLEQMEEILSNHHISKLFEGLKLKVMTIKGPLESGYERKLDMLAEKIQSNLKD